MIMGVMIVVIHRVIVLNPLSVSITAVCGSKSSHKLYSPPDSLITVKRKSIHIRFSLCLSSLNRAWQRGEGKFMLCLVGHQGPHVWIDSLAFRFWKDTNVSRVEDGQFKFQVQVACLWCSAPALARYCSVGLEWQMCVGELTDLSTDLRSACCNWSVFHLLSYLFVCQSLDSRRHIIDLCFKDIKDMWIQLTVWAWYAVSTVSYTGDSC